MSACLLGEPCRYDARSVPSAQVRALAQTYELVPVCPEQLGGLPTPRVPCELQPDGRVVDCDGADRTNAFRAGAQAAVSIARETGCARAILKENSPSCGVNAVYDGTFNDRRVQGEGIAARALREAGVHVESA